MPSFFYNRWFWAVAVFVAVGVGVAVYVFDVRLPFTQIGIQSVSPADGSVFYSGDVIPFVIEPGPGLTFSWVQVFAEIGGTITDVAPYQLSLQIPDTFIGPLSVHIIAMTTDGRTVSRDFTL